MSATSIYFNGRMTRVPGAYSEIDASALESVGLGASGYVAILGTAVGGKPYSAIDTSDVPGTIQKSVRPGIAKTLFKSGDLLEAEALAFNPSIDENIKGAQLVYWAKVNQSTNSSTTLPNADGDSLTLTSIGYGYDTTQISVEVATGTVGGKLYTITYGDTEEVFDNIGVDAVFSLTYLASTPGEGFTTITAAVSAAAVTAAFTRTQAGLDSDISNPVDVVGYAAEAKIEVVSNSASDTAVVVELYGTDASADAIREQVTLTGITAVPTVNDFNDFHGCRVVSGTAIGTITVQNLSGGTAITTMAPATVTSALGVCTDMPVQGPVVCTTGTATCQRRVTLVGKNAAGVAQVETIQLNGTSNVTSTLSWSQLTYVAVGDLQAGVTLTVSGNAFALYYNTYDTLQKCANKTNQIPGMTWVNKRGELNFEMANMDIYAATNIKSAANPSFYATIYDAVQAITAGSALVVPTRAASATSAPSNTSNAVFLAGGNEGSAVAGSEGTPTATASDWEAALLVLTKLYVNTIVVMSGDPAVHALLAAHIAYMCGSGRMERDGVVGLCADDGGGVYTTNLPTKTEIKAQIMALNTRHLRCVAQKCERYNVAGVKTVFPTYYTAVLVAGMQAGSSVGTSLTHKYMNSISISADSTWHPKDDADEMIAMGLMFGEVMDGVGRRWVRNITSHLTTSNIAYTEASVNEAANYAAYSYRSQLELVVGAKGSSGTIVGADGAAREILRLLMDDVLTAWRSLSWLLTLDVLENSVEMAPVIPVNFVKSTIHLISVPQTA